MNTGTGDTFAPNPGVTFAPKPQYCQYVTQPFRVKLGDKGTFRGDWGTFRGDLGAYYSTYFWCQMQASLEQRSGAVET